MNQFRSGTRVDPYAEEEKEKRLMEFIENALAKSVEKTVERTVVKTMERLKNTPTQQSSVAAQCHEAFYSSSSSNYSSSENGGGFGKLSLEERLIDEKWMRPLSKETENQLEDVAILTKLLTTGKYVEDFRCLLSLK